MNELYNPGRVPVPPRKPDPDEIGLPLVSPWTMELIKKNEGAVDHLYKDVPGNITIGTGFNVHNQPEKAHEMGMYWTDEKGVKTPRRASIGDVQEAFKKMEPLPPGKPAGFYSPEKNKALSNIRIHESSVDEILRKKLEAEEYSLRRKIRNFDTAPYPARQIALDMQYNMGDSRFNPGTWPGFFAAMNERDYKKAAEESHRKEIQEERNKESHKYLMEAYYLEQRKKNR